MVLWYRSSVTMGGFWYYGRECEWCLLLREDGRLFIMLYCGLREICRSLWLVCNQIEQRGLGRDPLFTRVDLFVIKGW